MTLLLLRPLIYLRIDHGSGALPRMNWGLPTLATAVVVAVGALLFPGINAFHSGGVFDRLLGFVQNLPGFYLAALAAVATFSRADLDQLMPGTPPRVSILYHGKPRTVELTRRRFLCLMFAYLTTISIVLTLALIVGLPMVDMVRGLLPASVLPYVRASASSCIVFLTAQMVTITLWGLYYLGERMHTPD